MKITQYILLTQEVMCPRCGTGKYHEASLIRQYLLFSIGISEKALLYIWA
jgi:hypothetical protein